MTHQLATECIATFVKLYFPAGSKVAAAAVGLLFSVVVALNMNSNQEMLFMLGQTLITVQAVIFLLCVIVIYIDHYQQDEIEQLNDHNVFTSHINTSTDVFTALISNQLLNGRFVTEHARESDKAVMVILPDEP